MLAFAIAFSIVAVVVPVRSFASSGSNLLVDSSAVTAFDSYLGNHLVGDLPYVDEKNACWTIIDRCFSASGLGLVKEGGIYACATLWNKAIERDAVSLAAYFLLTGTIKIPNAVVKFDSSLGVYRLQEKYSGLWLVNSAGHFPYYRPETVDDTTGTEVYRTGQWINMQKVGTQTVLWHIASNYELNEFKDQWSDLYPNVRIVETENYYWLVRSDRYTAYVLCDKYGYPYYLPKDGKTAISTPNNYYQDTTNEYFEENTTNNYFDYENNEYNEYDNSTNVSVMDGGSALVGSPIDINNGVINVGGELQYIDNLTYDASTQTYYIDSHDEYTYNSTTNNYTTNFNLYQVEYHINYTSITYIGQTSEYDKRYELYYQLPDGRSSADLTAEDLEQLSVVFADVVQYARSADDTSLRVLYHFDGNTEDSSYWSYCTEFDWSKGASLTYMDEGVFNGSLYLDETEHEFTITLPNAADLSQDFTVQFRYYQSYTAAPVNDSYLALGGEPLLYFSGSQYLTPSGAVLAGTSIGTWNEICIMREGSECCYYVNGVCCLQVDLETVYSNSITFHFGSEQQTYKKIDELRVTRGAVYTPGEDYAPSAVPHDTNLTLILPDGDRPIADEILVLTESENNLLTDEGLSDWTDEGIISELTQYTTPSQNGDLWKSSFSDGIHLAYNPSYSVFTANPEFTAFRTLGTALSEKKGSAPVVDHFLNGLILPVGGYECGGLSYSHIPKTQWLSFGSAGETYCFSVLLSDGTYSYVVFTIIDGGLTVIKSVAGKNLSVGAFTLDSIQDAESGSYSFHWHYRCYGIYVMPAAGATVDIIHMELVEGSAPQFSVDWEVGVYSSGELEDSPVLAVRTNQPIAGYQIGGVRPSYPTEGLVYAMVENSRIISLQQYTGSAWEEVDGRIWTGARWIPYSSFDVFTLQDYYDIIGGSGDDYEYIYTEAGFWAWWQKQWNQFTKSLFDILKDIASSSGGSVDVSVSIENNTIIDDGDKEPFDTNVYRGIVKAMRRSINFFAGFFDFIYDGVNNFIDHLSDTSSEFYGLFFLSGFGG